MLKQLARHQVLVVAIVMTFSAKVYALAPASRTFVSTIGNDANVSVNCSAGASCRTFTAALSVTVAGGEVVVLNSGGYGPATIGQAVLITAAGVDASISAPSGNGLTINTSGDVTLTGLNLHGEGAGIDGVHVTSVGFLRMFNMLIENFTANGVNFSSGANLAIYDSSMNDNQNDGLLVSNASVAFVHGCSFDHNGVGVETSSGKVTVADSSAHYNITGFAADGGTMTLYNDRVILNSNGLVANSADGALYFAECLIADNGVAYAIGGTSTMAGTSPATSLITSGQTLTGTLGTALILQ